MSVLPDAALVFFFQPFQKTSAELMEWQLQRVVDGQPFLDYFFPFEQLQGVNIGLVTALTSSHPIVVASDANKAH